MIRILRRTALTVALVLISAGRVHAHGLEMFAGSTAPASGALRLNYEFTDKIPLPLIISLGGTSFYSDIFPGYEWVQEDQPADGLYALKVGTRLTMQIVAIAAGASVKLDTTTLSAAGQSGFVATTTNVPGDHFHPQWQLTLPDGVIGDYSVSFKVTTTTEPYTESPVYTLIFTNAAPTPTPTATPTPVRTNTPTASATPFIPGDANCDGSVSAADVSTELNLFGKESHPCGSDAVPDGRIDELDLGALVTLIFEDVDSLLE
jgi:hypothetical protein